MTSSTAAWQPACPFDDLPDGDVWPAVIDGHEIALFRVDGTVFATDGICTHGNARLCNGFVENGEIECPLHQGRFDIRTGKAQCEPLTEDLRTYPVRIDGGQVWVQLTE
jgi:naphthalene 1,2-dioxygenase ferredoxin component